MTPTDLRTLLDAATPGPWYTPSIGTDSITVSGSTDVGISAHSTIISFLPLEQTDIDGRNWLALGGTIQANRTLVATARNILPSLVRLWEAAEADVSAEHNGVSQRASRDEMEAALTELRNAKGTQ